ncbi:hypothetical protein [Candidatus Odyssella thessalonicensis]|uniref:hypothetical protein n=1 Tax=Candidatus Odyssella thessalonicensis TaxID=84647 RepID=UPI0002DB2323|nr:hypothetical protein [Candidatus Odyssella thessalonicensis]
MLEDTIVLINDLHTTITTYWLNHPIFTAIIGGLIAIRLGWAIFKAARQLIKVLFARS